MPTYEYACPDCGVVEHFQSMKEDALTRCPRCRKRKVTRLLSGGGGVIFKGSGFWETDYNRSADYTSKAKGESGGGAAGDSGKKSDGGTAKPAADAPSTGGSASAPVPTPSPAPAPKPAKS